MGHWGIGTDEGDGPHDLLLEVFSIVHLSLPIHNSSSTFGKLRRASRLAILPVVGTLRPSLLDVAGFVLILLNLNYGTLIHELALCMAEVALRRELLPERLQEWKKGRGVQVTNELRYVQSEFFRRQGPPLKQVLRGVLEPHCTKIQPKDVSVNRYRYNIFTHVRGYQQLTVCL